MTDNAPEYNQIWLGNSDTASASGYFPVLGSVNTLATATFGQKNTIGDATKDSEDYISTLILSDLSGGMNVEDMNEGSDQARCWTAFADIRRPGKIALNTRVEEITPPVGAPSGPAYSCGQIVDTPYFLIGTASDIRAYGRKESDGTWYSGVSLNPDIVPVGKPVMFINKIFVPCGSSGYLIISEADSVGNPGVPTLTNVTTGAQQYPSGYNSASLDVNPPMAVAFCVFDNKLWALTTGGAVAWSFSGNDDDWTWYYDEIRGWYPKIQSGEDPQNLIGFYDPQGNPALFVISDRGAYIYNTSTPVSMVTTPIQFPPHPDFGGAAAIWRAGEDMHVAAGLDSIRYTSANVVVPLSGLARDDGVPQELFGSIHDFEAETSELYALIGPVTNGASGYVYNDTVGSAGTGDGQFDDVRGLCVLSTGDVIAGDENNERIQKFDSALTYSAKTGSAGTGNGEFSSNNGPYDVDRDSSDNIFVVDRGNSRIQKFNSSLSYQSQFGSFDDGTPAVAYSESWSLGATYGSTGIGTGNFDTPAQVAVDSSGNTYTADTANNRVIKRDSSGSYVGAITGLSGVTGVCVDSGGFIYPCGGNTIWKYNSSLVNVDSLTASGRSFRHIATDSTYLYATDVTGSRVTKADFASGIVASWGSSGSGSSQFSTPWGICTNGTYVWVVDSGNSRVQKFTTTGVYVGQWVVSAGCRGCAVNSDGEVMVVGFTADTVYRYTGDGVTLLGSFSQADGDGIAIHTDGVVWVTNATSDNLTKWTVSETPASAAAGPANGSFNLPQGIAIKRSSGRIYVTDSGNHRVQYFTSSGVYEGKFGSSTVNASTGAITAGTATGEFDTPTGIAINQDTGNVYVIDSGNDRVQEFTATGTFVRTFGTSGTGDGQFTDPTAIDVHPDVDTIYVSDSTRDDVQIFSPGGSFIFKIGSSGTANGQFASPSGVAFDSTGDNLYVSDLGNEDVQEFTFSAATSGQTYPWLAAWTGIGWYGKWRSPDIAISPNHMHVTATAYAYSLYWGDEDGNIYRSKLRRYFHNPRRALLAGEDEFEETGEIITPRFDAAMLGFWKLASHMVVFMDNATDDEYITIEYKTDANDSWVSLGTVSSTDKTYLPFGTINSDSGFSGGIAFNWISFRIRLFRGEDTFQTPIIKSMVFAYQKIPQNANAFEFLIPFPRDVYIDGRSGKDIREALNTLVTSRSYLTLRLPDQNGEEISYRTYVTALSGDDVPSQYQIGQRSIHLIEIRDSE